MFLKSTLCAGDKEELRYVAGDKTEWARRVRELRTEFGWADCNEDHRSPDLPSGLRVQADRQSGNMTGSFPTMLVGKCYGVTGTGARHVDGRTMKLTRPDPRHWSCII